MVHPLFNGMVYRDSFGQKATRWERQLSVDSVEKVGPGFHGRNESPLVL